MKCAYGGESGRNRNFTLASKATLPNSVYVGVHVRSRSKQSELPFAFSIGNVIKQVKVRKFSRIQISF